MFCLSAFFNYFFKSYMMILTSETTNWIGFYNWHFEVVTLFEFGPGPAMYRSTTFEQAPAMTKTTSSPDLYLVYRIFQRKRMQKIDGQLIRKAYKVVKWLIHWGYSHHPWPSMLTLLLFASRLFYSSLSFIIC